MAALLELAVETGKWDAGLKKGQSALNSFVQAQGGFSQALEKDNEKIAQFVKMMGDMDSTATTAKGKMADYKKSIEQLTEQYNRLTDAQKNSDVGLAYAESIEKIKVKYKEAGGEAEKLNKELGITTTESKGAGNALDRLSESLGGNLKQLTLLGGALAAGTAALKVAKDAFFANEEQLDEWGRTVESASSLYDGFLNALNTGDISGYLSRIGEITQAARDAYNALDALNTFNAFNQINVEKTRTGMTEAIVDYREGKGTKDQVRAAGDAYKKELQERKRLEKDAYIEAVGKVAAERGVSKQDLLDALSGTYGNYQNLKKVQMTGERIVSYGGGMFGGGGIYTEKYAKTQQEKLGEALRHLNDTELQSLQALGAQAQRTGNEIAQVDKQLVRVLNGRQGLGSGSGSGKTAKNEVVEAEDKVIERMEGLTLGTYDTYQSMNELKKQLDKYNQAIATATNATDEMAARQGATNIQKLMSTDARMWGATELGQRSMAAGIDYNGFNDISRKMGDAIGKNIKGLEISSSKIGKSLDDQEKSNLTMIGSLKEMTGGLSSISSGIQQMGVEIPEELSNVINALTGISTIVTGISTIVSAIELVQSATAFIPFFAHGGVVHAANGFVPGNRYSTDDIPVMVSSGELILNRAQQGALAADLQRKDSGTVPSQPYVNGEQIYLGLSNYLQRIGRGEIVTTRR